MLSYDTHKHMVDLSHSIHMAGERRVPSDCTVRLRGIMYVREIHLIFPEGQMCGLKNLCIVVEISKWQPLDLFSNPLSGSNSKQNVADGMQEYLNLKHPEGDPPAGEAIPPPRFPWIMNPNQHVIKDSSHSTAHICGLGAAFEPKCAFQDFCLGWPQSPSEVTFPWLGKGRAPRQESLIFKLL